MAIRVEHDLHRRRLGRNLGVGLVLAAFVSLTFGLTIAKVAEMGPEGLLGQEAMAPPADAAALAPAPAPAGGTAPGGSE